jgi:hypothetical protein
MRESQGLSDLGTKRVHFVSDAAYALRPDQREVLANLGGIDSGRHSKIFGRTRSGASTHRQTPEVDRQTSDGCIRDVHPHRMQTTGPRCAPRFDGVVRTSGDRRNRYRRRMRPFTAIVVIGLIILIIGAFAVKLASTGLTP